MPAPLVLIIRDGWGHNPNTSHDTFNAVKLAHTPVADQLAADWPTTLIKTSGEDVGLPAGTMGNSEVGHQNIGAGRIVDQELMRITRAIRDRTFFTRPAFLAAIDHALRNHSALHLLGLVSNGQVHSDIEHLEALLDLAHEQNFPADRVFIHVITDGRDTGPNTGLAFVEALEKKLDHGRLGRIASVCGRFFTMDRDHRWERTAAAYACLTNRGAAVKSVRDAASAITALREAYANPADPSRAGDEFIPPTRIINAAGQPLTLISDNDAVIFFNFRGDRPRQITRAFMLTDAEWAGVQGGGFDRGAPISNLFFCTMTAYESGLPVTAVAFEKPPKMKGILGEVIANASLAQFRCAETEKFAHVTFFFNDYREEPFPLEQRVIVPSPKDVATYDQKPEMSAYGVCDALLDRLAAADCEPLIVVNFANGDMVGHTGKLPAAIKAVEVVDQCVGRIVHATLARGGCLIITADHGNAEQMWNPITNAPHTAHTTFDVPLIVVGENVRHAALRPNGRLGDIAPTALHMLDLAYLQPPEMTGRSLLLPPSSTTPER